ncbi:MAG: helix-turn-helix domain-containing protein [Haloferacaceae archaeon]
MERGRSAREETDLEAILDALDDDAARRIIRSLDEPMTASELSDACDIPLSTTYRKLDLLTDASLLLQGTEIRSDGHHATTYEVAFDAVHIELTDDRDFAVSVEKREWAPEERLASLWSEVRKET